MEHAGFMDWIKEHPYLTGGLILGIIVLFVILRGSSSSSGTTVQATNTTALQEAELAANAQQQQTQAALQAQTQQYNAALEGAQIQEQTQIATATIGAAAQNQQTVQQTAQATIAANAQTALGNTSAQLGAIQSQLASATALGQSADQYNSANTIAGIQLQGIENTNASNTSIAGIQAGVLNNMYSDQLKSQQDINAASVAINQQNVTGNVTEAQLAEALGLTQSNNETAFNIANSNNSLTLGLNTNQTQLQETNITSGNQLQAIENTNAANVTNANTTASTAVTLAQLTNQAQNAAITNESGVYNNLINTEGNVALASEANQNQTIAGLLAQLNSGTFNKGGEGGTNQVAVASELTGNPSVGVAAVNSSAAANTITAQGNNPATYFSGIGNLLSNIF